MLGGITVMLLACAAPSGLEVPERPEDNVTELRSLEGVTLDEITRRFGPPTKSRTFSMAECCTEFTIELYNTYSPGDPAHAAVEIQELTYRYSGYAMTLWLHVPRKASPGAWEVLDTCVYTDEVEF